jgi:hypothetical protein
VLQPHRLRQPTTSSTSSSTTAVTHSPARPNISDLLMWACQCLWGVLSDPAVMGVATQPAAWMPDMSALFMSTGRLLGATTGQLGQAIDKGLSEGPLHEHVSNLPLQLVQLLPVLQMSQQQAGWRHTSKALAVLLQLHLRAACLLSHHSYQLTEADKDHLALLLGGGPGRSTPGTTPRPTPWSSTPASTLGGQGSAGGSTSATATPSTPPPAPAILSQPGPEQDKALQEFALALLTRADAYVELAGGGSTHELDTAGDVETRGTPIAGALSQALGAERVPHLADLYEQWKVEGVLGGMRDLTYSSTHPQSQTHLQWLHREVVTLVGSIVQQQRC